MPPIRNRLTVRVNDELTLDAGWWEEVRTGDGEVRRRVHPPQRTMFDQVLDYLTSVPVEPGYQGLHLAEEAVAATAACLRWGSYLAVLADRDLHLWSEARQRVKSRIADAEMARINVEASAALARWIELMRGDRDRYCSLVWAAHRLPMTRKRAKRDRSQILLLALAHPEVFAARLPMPGPERVARAEAEAHPDRVLANALANACFRNTEPLERIHAGASSSYPLTLRRITPLEERGLIRTSAGRLAQGILAASALILEESERTWAQRVLPFHLAHFWAVTPTGWSLEERTREIELPGSEGAGPG